MPGFVQECDCSLHDIGSSRCWTHTVKFLKPRYSQSIMSYYPMYPFGLHNISIDLTHKVYDVVNLKLKVTRLTGLSLKPVKPQLIWNCQLICKLTTFDLLDRLRQGVALLVLGHYTISWQQEQIDMLHTICMTVSIPSSWVLILVLIWPRQQNLTSVHSQVKKWSWRNCLGSNLNTTSYQHTDIAMAHHHHSVVEQVTTSFL